MNLRDKKGSISIFVLVALLFMSGFLIISVANNAGKSKTIKEQFNIISDIYVYTEGDEGAYEKAYTQLREKNKQTMTASSENSTTLELTKTFNENVSDYRIYGNSIQNGTPSPTNPVEVENVGNITKNIYSSKTVVYLNRLTSIDTIKVKPHTDYVISVDKYTISEPIWAIRGTTEYVENLTPHNAWNIGTAIVSMTNKFNSGEYEYITIRVWAENSNYGIDENTKIQIEEGKIRTEYEPYNKYKIPVKVSGNNLLNPNIVQDLNVYIRSDNGEEVIPISTEETWRVSDYIYVAENKTYHLNAINSDQSIAGIAWYDIDKNYISGLTTTKVNQNNGNMTAPENAKYLRISWRIDEGYNPNWKDTVQLEEGETVNIYLDEPLRKAGDYVDYIDFKTGKVVRNIKEIALTGTEYWGPYGGVFYSTILDSTAKRNMLSIYNTHYDKSSSNKVANCPNHANFVGDGQRLLLYS